MSVQSVRLDEDDKATLAELVARTGLSASEVLRRGLEALRREIVTAPPRTPQELYFSLDLGPGGYALGPSDESEETLARLFQQKREQS
jgi:Arc/MetJ-type ribon-helix-helix transcriptional regulator